MNKDELNRLADVVIRGLTDARDPSELLLRTRTLTEAARILDARTRVLPENLRNELLEKLASLIDQKIAAAMNQIMNAVNNAISESLSEMINSTISSTIHNTVRDVIIDFLKEEDPGFLYWNGEKIEVVGSETCDEESEGEKNA